MPKRETYCDICGAATSNEAYLCWACVDALRADLSEVGWLLVQLDITCSRERSPKLSPLIKGGGSIPEPRWAAISARAELRIILTQAVGYLVFKDSRRKSPTDHISAHADWLRQNASLLATDVRGPMIMRRVTRTIKRAKVTIDLRPERQYLGVCATCGEGGMYAVRGETLATCRSCHEAQPAEELRTRKLAELDDRLCTAGEIADLSTYLGLHANRDQVRKRINAWHSRGIITAEASRALANPRFQFGLVWRMLIADDARRSAPKLTESASPAPQA